MKRLVSFGALTLLVTCGLALAEPTNLAEDDAASYGNWENDKGSGTGFGNWTLVTEAGGENRHAGFFIASKENNPDLEGIGKDGKAFGLYANGDGFEQAVAFRPFNKPLAVGDSFSFMMETGKFEKKSPKDEGVNGSVGLVLRSGNANAATGDYNHGALFEFGHYQGKENYQIYDGSGASANDSGVPFTDQGVIVTVTVTGDDTYDLEIQALPEKKLTKLPGRKFSSSGKAESFAIFNRNSEKNDAFFNQFQVTHDEK